MDVGSVLNNNHNNINSNHSNINNSHSNINNSFEQCPDDDERLRLRRKLENLELELKAAELVTSDTLDTIDNVPDTNSNKPNVAHKHPLVKKRSSNSREPSKNVEPKSSTNSRVVRSCSKDSLKTRHMTRSSSRDSVPDHSVTRDTDGDNCVMCVRERREDVRKASIKLRTPAEQRLANKSLVTVVADNQPSRTVQRSKSDAQDKLANEDIIISDNVRAKNSFSSKIIKRSMSFNRIFHNSMLSRSKEYRL